MTKNIVKQTREILDTKVGTNPSRYIHTTYQLSNLFLFYLTIEFRCPIHGCVPLKKVMSRSAADTKSPQVVYASLLQETMVLNICMVLALVVSDKSTIDKYWELEDLKKLIDRSNNNSGTSFPPLNLTALNQGLGLWKSRLENVYALVLDPTRPSVKNGVSGLSSGNEKLSEKARCWKVKITMIQTPPEGGSDRRAAVENLRQQLLKRLKLHSLFECASLDGLRILVTAIASVVPTVSPLTKKAVLAMKPKPLEEVKSRTTVLKRVRELAAAGANIGFNPDEVEALAKQLADRTSVSPQQKNDITREEEVMMRKVAEEEQMMANADARCIDVERCNEEQLARACRSNERVEKLLAAIKKRNNPLFSLKQQVNGLEVYDACLLALLQLHDDAVPVSMAQLDKVRKVLEGRAVVATVELLRKVREYAFVDNEEIKRWLVNRGRRVAEKKKPGPQVIHEFEQDVCAELMIVVIEVSAVVLTINQCMTAAISDLNAQHHTFLRIRSLWNRRNNHRQCARKAEPILVRSWLKKHRRKEVPR